MDNVDRLDRDNQLAAFLTHAMVHELDPRFRRFADGAMRRMNGIRIGLPSTLTGREVVFHISPPRFIDVVKSADSKRVSIEYLSKDAGGDKTYEIESGMRIRYGG